MNADNLIFKCWTGTSMSQPFTISDLIEKTCFDAGVIYLQLVEENKPLKRKVFVGDIIKGYRRDDAAKKQPVLSEVTFLNGCYMAFNCTWHELYRFWQSDFEVVGNIFQDAKILEPDYQTTIPQVEIEEMNFSTRSFNGLKASKINSLADIINNTTIKTLSRIRNLGAHSIAEIESAVLQWGFRIRKR